MEDTKEQLTEILEMYNIGKKPLARLLGWGDTTVMNQMKASSASTEFAEKINAIHESPYVFSEILEQNKRKLTEVAYRKARAAVDKRMLRDKSSLLVRYLMKHVNFDIAPYQVMAALFYSQAASLLLKGRPLFDDDVCYMRKSAVPYPDIYATLIKNGIQNTKTATDVLTNEEKDIISSMNKVLSGYSPLAVKAMLKADRIGLMKGHSDNEGADNDGVMISLSEFQEYFKDEMQEIGFAELRDFRKYWEQKLKKQH